MQVIAGLKQLYDDRVVVELVTLPLGSQKSLSRHGRDILADKEQKVQKVSKTVPFFS